MWITCHSVALLIFECRDNYATFILVQFVCFYDFSDEQENNSQQVKETSDDPDKQEQDQIQDSKPPPSIPQKDTKISITTGGVVGRGRIKKK